jgi:ferredoxin
MPLQSKLLGAALNEDLSLHSTLCRREAGAFQAAVLAAEKSGDKVVVACTQEQRLFNELAGQTEGVQSLAERPLKFVNIRETGGWSKDAATAMPKIAALLALAHLPDPEPVPTVTFKSAGRLLIIGPLGAAERYAQMLDDALEVTVFSQGPAIRSGNFASGEQFGAQERQFPVLAGQIESLSGWLGEFELTWSRNNPIDLDLCTRCNACLAVCPEGAIGLDYQIDSGLCKSSKDCVKVCSVAGAIDFARKASSHIEKFDLVLDLRADCAPGTSFTQHAPPQGYFSLPADRGRDDGTRVLAGLSEAQTLFKLRDLVGEFEKPKFFNYKQKLCAHSRNKQVGCSACIDVCSALAISSEVSRQQIKVNPNLCVGCGACTTVCPTGALTYAYPRASEQGVKLKTLLATYARAGGKNAAVLLHSEEGGARLVNALGRAAQLGSKPAASKASPKISGVPARVLPVALWHTASIGLDLWLTAVAYGASQVWVLMTAEEAPQYRDAVRAQMDLAQAILTALGYQGSHFRIIEANGPHDLAGLAALDAALQAPAAQGVGRAASFAVQADKRATLDLALDHLLEQASQKPEEIALGAASPFGSLNINKDACTLCLSCVSACPASALQDNALLPQLKFIEKNCVQCGLCVSTCPEDAITLQPRLLLTTQRKETRVLNEAKPYACVRCSKPFGTFKAIEAMLGKLAGHSMFQGDALERLKMCGDCRVIDIYSSSNEAKITDL